MITKYYHRHEKAVKRFMKKLLILGIVALIIAVIGAVIYFVNESKEKQYEEAGPREEARHQPCGVP